MKKVMLISMPFGALERPGLGISLLKTRLSESNITCDVQYFTFAFAELVGYEEYEWISSELPYTAFAGDWAFTQALYGQHPEVDSGYIQEILCGTWHLDEFAIEHILRIRSLVPHFLDHCVAAIPWEEYTIIGFTSTFEQNIASLALAKRIKAKFPEITVVFGGANWEGEMGHELHRKFTFVDYVCSGEADVSFPALVAHLLTDGTANDSAGMIDGIVYREKGKTRATRPAALILQMDELPTPDFRDFFQELNQSTVGALVDPILLLETSRGCWWGAKSHCTFCGLNGGTMTFRSKSGQRVLDELEHLVTQWQVEFVEVVDNILDMRYFKDMLPALAERQSPIRLFYEVKANLTRKHIKILYDAGVHRIQPGIESLSDHVLKLMRKGVSALQNIQLLKWCKEYDIAVDWNVLYGFPGETQDDYDAILELLPSLRHLTPPSGCGPVRLDRFSPYFNVPSEFGLTNLRPMAPYKYLYPFDNESLSRIAYYFDYDYKVKSDRPEYAAEVVEYVDAWKREREMGTLSSVIQSDGTLILLDTRSDATQPTLVLSGMEKAAYEHCDELRSVKSVEHHLHQVFSDARFTEQQVFGFLDSLVANRLMVTDSRHYLSLAIPVRPVKTVVDNITLCAL